MAQQPDQSQQEPQEEIIPQSFSGKRWAFRAYNQRQSDAIYQKFGTSEVLARLLASRDITIDNFERYIRPRLRDQLPNPFDLKDMDKAVDRILQAVNNGEKVAIFGDYDVDGATSSALMTRFLRHLGIEATIYIPDRIDEGYGPNAAAMEKLGKSHDLILTLDCGITAFDALNHAAECDIDVVVLDHHAAEPELPKAVAVVNPNRLDEDGSLGHLAAVGVVFITIIGVLSKLRDERGLEGLPDPRRWLDLVALGTVCDVMPLRGLNRAFVTQGLKVMDKGLNVGLQTLQDVAGIDELARSYHAGFVLGPRINAAGRIGDPALGSELLSCDDLDEAVAIAQTLDENNRTRQAMEREIMQQALEIAEEQAEQEPYILCVAGQGWHPGIVGLVASRLVSEYNRPAAAITIDESGMGKASSRSIDGIDLGAIVIAARQSGILASGGGHAMAAGFTLPADKIDQFQTFANEQIVKQHGTEPLKPLIEVDATLSPQGATIDLYEEIAQMEPFGRGNPKPRFLLKDVTVKKLDVFKDRHIRLIVGDINGHGNLKIMAFSMAQTQLGQALIQSGTGSRIHAVATLRVNEWQGRRTAEMTLEDAARAE